MREVVKQTFKVEKAKDKSFNLGKAVEGAAKKVEEDAQALKELQETNKVLLEKYQQNEKIILQRFLS